VNPCSHLAIRSSENAALDKAFFMSTKKRMTRDKPSDSPKVFSASSPEFRLWLQEEVAKRNAAKAGLTSDSNRQPSKADKV
jgi:hypothetical protein